jgi:hypothetical protein
MAKNGVQGMNAKTKAVYEKLSPSRKVAVRAGSDEEVKPVAYQSTTPEGKTIVQSSKYNPNAVQKEINKDKRIGGKEAKAIHSLLKGRTGDVVMCPNGHPFVPEMIAGFASAVKQQRERETKEYTAREIAAAKRIGTGKGYSSKRGDVAPVGDADEASSEEEWRQKIKAKHPKVTFEVLSAAGEVAAWVDGKEVGWYDLDKAVAPVGDEAVWRTCEKCRGKGCPSCKNVGAYKINVTVPKGEAKDTPAVKPITQAANVAPIAKVMPRSKRPGRDISKLAKEESKGSQTEYKKTVAENNARAGLSNNPKFAAKDAADLDRQLKEARHEMAVAKRDGSSLDYQRHTADIVKRLEKELAAAGAEDASPFDVDSDFGSAKIVLREMNQGHTAKAIATKYGFDIQFVLDVGNGKYGKTEAELKRNLREVKPVGDAGPEFGPYTSKVYKAKADLQRAQSRMSAVNQGGQRSRNNTNASEAEAQLERAKKAYEHIMAVARGAESEDVKPVGDFGGGESTIMNHYDAEAAAKKASHAEMKGDWATAAKYWLEASNLNKKAGNKQYVARQLELHKEALAKRSST